MIQGFWDIRREVGTETFPFLCITIIFSRLSVQPTFSFNIVDANRLCVFHQVRECPGQLHCFLLSVYPRKIKQIHFPLIKE